MPEDRDRLLFVAGASLSGHLDSLETLAIADLAPGSVPIERGSWPGFRGRGNGRSSSEDLPLEWSTEGDVAWRVRLPGYGQSAPVRGAFLVRSGEELVRIGVEPAPASLAPGRDIAAVRRPLADGASQQASER